MDIIKKPTISSLKEHTRIEIHLRYSHGYVSLSASVCLEDKPIAAEQLRAAMQ